MQHAEKTLIFQRSIGYFSGPLDGMKNVLSHSFSDMILRTS